MSGYTTMGQVKRANREAGQHWFDPGTIRFFRSRIGRTLYGGRYFVSSEQREWNTPRRYTVREALPNGRVETVGRFMEHRTRAEAVAAARRLVRP